MIYISLVSPNSFSIEEIINEDIFINKYLHETKDGFMSIEDCFVANWANVELFFKYLFNSALRFPILLEENNLKVYDLTEFKKDIVTFEDLDKFYSKWIVESRHENTMDEYGTFIGAIGFIRRNLNNNYLLARVEIKELTN